MSAVQMEKIFNLPNSSMYSYFKLFDIPSKTLAYASKESIQEKRSKIHMQYHLKWRYDSHTTWDNKKVNLRSINEIQYAKHLDEQKILYEVETLRTLTDKLNNYDSSTMNLNFFLKENMH